MEKSMRLMSRPQLRACLRVRFIPTTNRYSAEEASRNSIGSFIRMRMTMNTFRCLFHERKSYSSYSTWRRSDSTKMSGTPTLTCARLVSWEHLLLARETWNSKTWKRTTSGWLCVSDRGSSRVFMQCVTSTNSTRKRSISSSTRPRMTILSSRFLRCQNLALMMRLD